MRFRLFPLPVVIVATAALAGSAFATPALAAADQLSSVTVTGAIDEKPTIAVSEPVSVKSSVAKVFTEGDGTKVRKGSTVTLDYILVNGRTGVEVDSSYGRSAPPLSLDRTKTKPVIVDNLVGESVGSRVMIAIAPNEGMAKQLASDTVKKNDTLLFVVDLHSAYGPFERATGTAVAPADGLPTVKLTKNGVPTITMPKAAAPATLVVQPLITGNGPAVQAGQTITVQHTGAIWETGKVFDSSWKAGKPFQTQIGTQQVIAGWDTGLVGQTVGSQLLLVIPPDQGYGAGGNGDIKGTDTLVFVVDILDAL